MRGIPGCGVWCLCRLGVGERGTGGENRRKDDQDTYGAASAGTVVWRRCFHHFEMVRRAGAATVPSITMGYG